jgi:hypothetical protein
MCISVQRRIKADILSNLWGVGVMVVVAAVVLLSLSQCIIFYTPIYFTCHLYLCYALMHTHLLYTLLCSFLGLWQ